MRLKAAFLTAALALIGAGSANADITLTLGDFDAGGNFTPSSSKVFDGTEPIVFGGVIDVTSLTHIEQTSFTVTNGVTVTDFFGFGGGDPDLATAPVDLSAAFSSDDLFELSDLAGPLANGPVTGTYFLIDEAGAVLASADFSVSGAPVVPEPGSLALLAGGLAGGSLSLIRRRRK